MPKTDVERVSARHRFEAILSRVLIGAALFLPYATRVRFFGWLMARVIAPLAGWTRRVRNNLALVMPDLPKSEVERITAKVCNNVGRALIEIYSSDEFLDRVSDTQFEGPGAGALKQAISQKESLVLVTAHIGNYDVVRGLLARQGVDLAALYRPLSNRSFNERYVEAISTISSPVYPVGRAGVASLVRHLRNGGSIGIVADVANFNGPIITFMGQPAHTPISAAEWAVKHNATLIPVFALRKDDGLTFRIHVADPIPNDAPEVMFAEYNRVLEELIRANVDQWFWIHNRWKLSPAALAAIEERGDRD